jgi:hypothetical protein
VGTDATMRQATVRSKGRQFLQDILDFISRPYSPLRSLRRKTGESLPSPWPSVRLRFRARFLPAGTPFENSIYGRLPHTTSSHTPSRSDTPLSIPFYQYSLLLSSLNTSPCLGLQKAVRPCFSVLNSRQISYGRRLLMRIWNLLEWRPWILIPLFPNTSESLVFTRRLTGIGRVGVGSSLGSSATLRVPEQWCSVLMVEKVTSCGSF